MKDDEHQTRLASKCIPIKVTLDESLANRQDKIPQIFRKAAASTEYRG